MDKKKPWDGRFDAPTDSVVEAFTASVVVDRRLYEQDIAGSVAHTKMLVACSVLSQQDGDAITQGLEAIRRDIEQGNFDWLDELEDVHMNIETELTRRIGDAGKRLHTARSRNDQVATDMRLWVRQSIDHLHGSLATLRTAIVDQAEAHSDTIMPGFTHLQTAQPVTLGHHLLAWNEMLARDANRLRDARLRTDVSPLGAAALAGTSYPIDREMSARSLGFDSVARNSLDAVSDRDFAIEYVFTCSLIMVHLSRMSEEIVLWASDAFGFADPGDAFCTGSSIMPQKKNPDVAELIRGKSARVQGSLTTLMTLMKGQPLTYNRDNQEDKQPVFDAADTVSACVTVMARMMANMTFNRDAMYEAAGRGFSTATDLADYLVRRGVPFRDSHAIVGNVVRHAQNEKVDIAELELAALQGFSGEIEADVFDVLTLEGSVASRNHIGATAPQRVREEVAIARQRISEGL